MNEPHSVEAGSHEFQFAGAALVPVFGPTLAGFVGVVALLHFLNLLNWLPPPKPALTGDEFVMRNRFETAMSGEPAEVLIIGDSSSVMGVDASALGPLLPGQPRVYNLGLFLGLPMEVYAEAAQKFIERHPGQVRAVILLTTFSRLADAKPAGPSTAYWRSLFEPGAESKQIESTGLEGLLMVGSFGQGVMARILPFERHGRIGVFYGGNAQAAAFVKAHQGSAFAREVYNRQTSTEKVHWALDPETMAHARHTRAALPREIAFIYGVMPMPETYGDSAASAHRARIMREINGELQADYLLMHTPATLPDGLFSDLVHLNLNGQGRFTRLLAEELAKLPVWKSVMISEESGK